jgi:predicted phage terminase large subunit-like protein
MASRLTDRRWQWARHIDYVNERVTAGIIRGNARIIICEPPGHGKSEYMSHWTPAWFLEHWPWKKVMLGSYGQSLASGFGRLVRDTIQEHERRLRVRVRADSTAADEWLTTAGGGMMSRGTDGVFTGKRGHLLLIDDPVKNAEEAFSDAYQMKVWRWWDATAATRLEPGASVIITHTRWTPGDLIGRLLEQQKEQANRPDRIPWEVINLPAMAEEDDALDRRVGEALWPQRWPIDELRRIRAERGSWVWAALYQQRPAPIEGGLFKREWFKITDRLPTGLTKVVRHWDLAASEAAAGSDPDYTVGVKMGRSGDGPIFVLDAVRGRWSADAVERIVAQTAAVDGIAVAQRMEQEPAAAGKSLISYYARKILAAFDFRGVIPSGDKVVRATPFAAACERGDVVLVNGPWVADFIEAHCNFPNAAHDDFVDAASGGFQYLAADQRDWTAADWGEVMQPQLAKKPTPMDKIREMLKAGQK